MPGKGRSCVVSERFGIGVARTHVKRDRLGLTQPCFESKTQYSELACFTFKVLEQGAGNASTPSRGHDVHAFQLTDARLHDPYAPTRDRLTGDPSDDKNALWRREFGQRELSHVAAAVPHDVLLLHSLDEFE